MTDPTRFAKLSHRLEQYDKAQQKSTQQGNTPKPSSGVLGKVTILNFQGEGVIDKIFRKILSFSWFQNANKQIPPPVGQETSQIARDDLEKQVKIALTQIFQSVVEGKVYTPEEDKILSYASHYFPETVKEVGVEMAMPIAAKGEELDKRLENVKPWLPEKDTEQIKPKKLSLAELEKVVKEFEAEVILQEEAGEERKILLEVLATSKPSASLEAASSNVVTNFLWGMLSVVVSSASSWLWEPATSPRDLNLQQLRQLVGEEGVKQAQETAKKRVAARNQEAIAVGDKDPKATSVVEIEKASQIKKPLNKESFQKAFNYPGLDYEKIDACCEGDYKELLRNEELFFHNVVMPVLWKDIAKQGVMSTTQMSSIGSYKSYYEAKAALSWFIKKTLGPQYLVILDNKTLDLTEKQVVKMVDDITGSRDMDTYANLPQEIADKFKELVTLRNELKTP